MLPCCRPDLSATQQVSPRVWTCARTVTSFHGAWLTSCREYGVSQGQGGPGLLKSQGLTLLRASKICMMAGHAPVQWHQCTMGDWKMPGLPRYGLWLYRVKSLRPRGPSGAVLNAVPICTCWIMKNESLSVIAYESTLASGDTLRARSVQKR